MKNIINSGIARWRALRNKKMLQMPYSDKYAFIGVGSHALQNLYPVIHFLGIQLKYICCKSPDKLQLIERRFDTIATTSLDVILDDNDVKGVFLCCSPTQHFELCSRIIPSGKFLFVEKPPCLSNYQLECLISADEDHKVMVGMQKRYSPFIGSLMKRISKTDIMNYALSYHTGAYPEGEPLTELFIHPVDLVSFLFGKVDKISIQKCEHNGAITAQMLLSHNNAKGLVELSNAYSWSHPEESMRVNTSSGEYRLEQMEQLSFYPHPKKIGGIPLEKLGIHTPSEQILAIRENFNPIITNNQLYVQGFFPEIKAFADMVEFSGKNLSPLSSMRDTYKILESLKTHLFL